MRVVLLTALAVVFLGCGTNPQVPVANETIDEKYEKVRASFEGASDAPNDVDTTGIEEFFRAYGAAVATSDIDAMGELFDVRMHYDVVKSQGLLPAELSDTDLVVSILEKRLLSRLVDPYEGIFFDRTDVHRVQSIDDTDAVIVYARHWSVDDAPSKIRWWLHRSNGAWRAYDIEMLEVSMRYSVMMGVGFAMADQADLDIAPLRELMASIQMAMSGLTEDSLERLRQLDESGFPPMIEAMRLLMIGAILSDMGEHQAALEAAEKLMQVNPDVPMVHLTFSSSYTGLGQYEQALESARRYADLLGEDADYFVEAGDAYLGMGMTDEAITAYERGLLDDPQSGFTVWGLLRSLPPSRQVEAHEAYANLEDVDMWFDGFAELSAREAQWADLERLIDLHRQVMPDDENLTFYGEVLRAKALPAADDGQPD